MVFRFFRSNPPLWDEETARALLLRTGSLISGSGGKLHRMRITDIAIAWTLPAEKVGIGAESDRWSTREAMSSTLGSEYDHAVSNVVVRCSNFAGCDLPDDWLFENFEVNIQVLFFFFNGRSPHMLLLLFYHDYLFILINGINAVR